MIAGQAMGQQACLQKQCSVHVGAQAAKFPPNCTCRLHLVSAWASIIIRGARPFCHRYARGCNKSNTRLGERGGESDEEIFDA